ncbi:MAG: alpha/beta hydrolase [Dehalococcoidia bacterium]
MRPRHGRLQANGVRLHYLEWGPEAAPPWLLLHGFTGTARQWQPLAETFGHRHRLIALDQRGHGLSGWAPGAAYSTDDHVADIVCLVEHLGLKRLLVAGHSMGGRNALLYTVYRPEAVSRLVVVDARPGPDRASSRALEAMVAALPHSVSSLKEAAGAVRSHFPRLSPTMARHLARYRWKRLANGGLVPHHDPALEEAARRGGFAPEDLSPLLGQIACPTLVVRGGESDILSQHGARLLARSIPGARLVEIAGAGHLVPWEQPEAFHRALAGFVEAA